MHQKPFYDIKYVQQGWESLIYTAFVDCFDLCGEEVLVLIPTGLATISERLQSLGQGVEARHRQEKARYGKQE